MAGHVYCFSHLCNKQEIQIGWIFTWRFTLRHFSIAKAYGCFLAGLKCILNYTQDVFGKRQEKKYLFELKSRAQRRHTKKRRRRQDDNKTMRRGNKAMTENRLWIRPALFPLPPCVCTLGSQRIVLFTVISRFVAYVFSLLQ